MEWDSAELVDVDLEVDDLELLYGGTDLVASRRLQGEINAGVALLPHRRQAPLGRRRGGGVGSTVAGAAPLPFPNGSASSKGDGWLGSERRSRGRRRRLGSDDDLQVRLLSWKRAWDDRRTSIFSPLPDNF